MGPSASPSTAAVIRGSAASSGKPTRAPWDKPQNPTGPTCSASRPGTVSSERTTATAYLRSVRWAARATTPGDVWSWPPPGARSTKPRGGEAGLKMCITDLSGSVGTRRSLLNSDRTARDRDLECPPSCCGNGDSPPPLVVLQQNLPHSEPNQPPLQVRGDGEHPPVRRTV